MRVVIVLAFIWKTCLITQYGRFGFGPYQVFYCKVMDFCSCGATFLEEDWQVFMDVLFCINHVFAPHCNEGNASIFMDSINIGRAVSLRGVLQFVLQPFHRLTSIRPLGNLANKNIGAQRRFGLVHFLFNFNKIISILLGSTNQIMKM